MDARTIARFTAGCRVAIGAAFVAYPPLSMRTWLGRDAARPTAVVLARALGARDVVLGAGTLASIGDEHQLQRWLAAATVADGVDLAATLAAGDALPAAGRAVIASVAAPAVALGVAALAMLRRRG